MIHDEKLFVTLINSGDSSALDFLYCEFMKSLQFLIWKFTRDAEEAKDVYHDLYFRICDATPHFRFECSYRTFISRIAYYFLINRAKKAKKEVTTELSALADPGESIEGLVIHKESRECVEKAFDQLSTDDQMLLIMKVNLGFRYHELEEILQVPANNLKIKVFRARKRLGELYHEVSGKRPK